MPNRSKLRTEREKRYAKRAAEALEEISLMAERLALICENGVKVHPVSLDAIDRRLVNKCQTARAALQSYVSVRNTGVWQAGRWKRKDERSEAPF